MRQQSTRPLPTAALVAIALVWGWIAWSYAGTTDRAVLVAEVAATAVLGVTALCAPTPRGRATIGLVAGWTGLTALGDSYWLFTAGSPSVGYAEGSYEPAPTVVAFLLRYALGAAVLALALPQHAGRRPRGVALGAAPGTVQVATAAAALITLVPPTGALLGERGPSPTFFAADLVLGVAAVGVVLRIVLARHRVPRPARRLLTATAVTVLALVAADAAMVVSLLNGSVSAGVLSSTASASGCVLCVVVHLRDRSDGVATACLPPAAGAGDRSRLLVRVLTRLVLPTSVLVVATHRVSTGDDLPAHQLGLVALALALALAGALGHLVRAERDERAAAAVVRDDLTGAWSRAGLVQQLRVRRAAARRDGAGTWTVVALDLDGFKSVNDTHGHAAGDAVLRATVTRIASVLGDQGLLARLGGDEFVVVLPSAGRRAGDPTGLVDRFLTAVAAPLELPGGAVCTVGVSAGTAVLDVHGWDGEAQGLLAEADHRMYQDKRTRRQSARTTPTDRRSAPRAGALRGN